MNHPEKMYKVSSNGALRSMNVKPFEFCDVRRESNNASFLETWNRTILIFSLDSSHKHQQIKTNSKQAADSKKDEYKRYLERTGVTDALTKVMVSLYEEPDKPSNAIDYIKKYLGAQNGVTEYDQLKKENEELKQRIKALETEVGNMRKQLADENEV